MGNIRVTVDAAAAVAALRAIEPRVEAAVQSAVDDAVRIGATIAQGMAPHRSGALASSIVVNDSAVSVGWAAEFGPTIRYGRREAIGFHGRDSRGRTYAEGGHVFMGPADGAMRQAASKLIAQRVSAALSG